MSFVLWNDDFSVGIDQVDTQHKRLIFLLNNMHDALTKGDTITIVQETLDSLVDYSINHFNDEEDIMVACNFPEYDAHKKIHNQLLENVILFQQKLNAGEEAISYELVDFLRDWLIDHIMREDKKYAKFIQLKNI